MEKIKALGKRVAVFASTTAILAMPMIAGATNLMNENLVKAVPDDLQKTGTGQDSLLNLIQQLISIVLGILGVLLVLYILYAGWLWFSSQGDNDKIKKVKDILINSVIGLLLILAAYSIATFVIASLGKATGIV
jgi:hypothetical protein